MAETQWIMHCLILKMNDDIGDAIQDQSVSHALIISTIWTLHIAFNFTDLQPPMAESSG